MFTIDHLEFYAKKHGWKLFPCSAKKKTPLTTNGHLDATTDLDTLLKWFKAHPECAWGSPTSAEAGVFEYDKRNDKSGEVWAMLQAQTFPLTWKSVSGGGSPHYWFRWPEGTRSKEIQNNALGRKADGGYVIVPPSKIEFHADRYKWENFFGETPIATVPDWILSLFCDKGLASLREATELRKNHSKFIVQEAEHDLITHLGCDKDKGEQRTPKLVKLIGIHFARGDNVETILALAETWAAKCNPPLDGWRKHVEGIARKEEANGNMLTPYTNKKIQKTQIQVEEIVSDPENLHQSVLISQVSKVGKKVSTPSADPYLLTYPSLPDATDGVEMVSTDTLESLVLHDDAYHGLFGEMLQAVNGKTEGDQPVILLGWMAMFGLLTGRKAWIEQAGTQYPILYVGVVGKTSGGKGTAWNMVRTPFTWSEPESTKCIAYGISTGQGLIDRVRDERQVLEVDKKTGEQLVKVIPGSEEKRCLVRLDELSLCLKLQASEKSTLAETIMTAWSGETLSTLNVSQGENYRLATDYSIAIVGDTQPGTIKKMLGGRVEGVSGWMNRFLWVAAKNTVDIAFPVKESELLKPYFARLQSALEAAKTAGEVSWSEEAASLWKEVYPSLKVCGDSVKHTDRARPYVTRLSLIFTLADSERVVRREHLTAALAVWDYCYRSASVVFGGVEVEGEKQSGDPEPMRMKVFNALPKDKWVSRTDLLLRFKKELKAEELKAILGQLKAEGLAISEMRQGNGRPSEFWKGQFPSDDKEDDGDDDGDVIETESEKVGSEGNEVDTPSYSTLSTGTYSPGKEGRKVSKSESDQGLTYLPTLTYPPNQSTSNQEGHTYLPTLPSQPISPTTVVHEKTEKAKMVSTDKPLTTILVDDESPMTEEELAEMMRRLAALGNDPPELSDDEKLLKKLFSV